MSPSLALQEALIAWGILVLGLLIGSFANVLIARIPEGLSIAWPGSRCPHCLTPIAWYDNVPLVSWLVLRGKCRACKAPISARYPLVELLVGLLFVAAYVQLGLSWQLASTLALIVFVVPLTFIDLEHWILPFELTLPGIAVGFLLAIPQGLPQLRDTAIGAAVGFFGFWAMEYVGRWAFKKEALGSGDKYLLALLGAYLTYRPMLGIVMLSSLQGSIIGLAMLAIFGRAAPPLKSAQSATTPDSAVLTPSGEPAKEEAVVAHAAIAAASGDSPAVLELSASPDSATAAPEVTDEDDWQPGPTNMPFGPWLALSGLEIVLLGPWLSHFISPQLAGFLFGYIGKS